ncbi:MAG: GAF domain-containing protein [Candidatus Marinimicrobia bacterium]|nr:GAF domain-containing protein [Candidatus Neomarinimicrobiota bacterium]MDD5582240.1 GAF domain-containing protein [Candidatus Neomarinimicrobiota bacterium]
MFEIANNYNSNKKFFYETLFSQLKAMMEEEKNVIALTANISSLLWHSLPRINWVGFYFYDEKDDELVLGPFQGKPACTRIKPGKGVCGVAFEKGKTQRIDDVYAFSGHIVCDPESRAELVIPLFKKNKGWGVLDIDSPENNRFDQKDQEGLERFARYLEAYLFNQASNG